MHSNDAAAAVSIERIVLKDLQFETAMDQKSFTTEWQPDYRVRPHLQLEHIVDDHWEFVLTATVTANLEPQVAFLIEAHQSNVVKVNQLEAN